MKSGRLLSLIGAGCLIAGTLAALLPAAQATVQATAPGCTGIVSGLDASNRVVHRAWKNATITAEKKSTRPLSVSPHALVWSGGRALDGGGFVSRYTAFINDTAPVVYDVANKTTSSTLSVTYVKKLSRWLKGRLVVTGGSYYLYAVDDAKLFQWTRFVDDAGRIWLGNAKVVAQDMRGLKTLAYGWTFKIDGVYKDVIYGTTGSGKLLQFQIPQLKPTYEKLTKLADSGFGAYDQVSTSFCNNSPHYLALVAIDKETNEARRYSLSSQTTPKTYNLVDRGLVGVGADWDLHAVG